MKNTTNKLDPKGDYDGRGLLVAECSSVVQHGRRSASKGAIYAGAKGRDPRSFHKPPRQPRRKKVFKNAEAEIADLVGPRQTRAQIAHEEMLAEQAKIAKARQMAAESRKNGDFDREKRTTATRCIQKSVHGEGLGYNE